MSNSDERLRAGQLKVALYVVLLMVLVASVYHGVLVLAS
jgi:hypothetical protein